MIFQLISTILILMPSSFSLFPLQLCYILKKWAIAHLGKNIIVFILQMKIYDAFSSPFVEWWYLLNGITGW